MIKKRVKIKMSFRRKAIKHLNKKRNQRVVASTLEFKVIPWASQAYLAGIDLRNECLNIPSNLPPITTIPKNECEAIHLAAMFQGRIVGTLFLDGTEREQVVQVKQVAISADYRGQRIGQQLMAFAERVAAERHYQEIVLNARDSAWYFYEKLAYQPFGDIYSNGSHQMQPYHKILDTVAQEDFSVVA